jgi:hypothetical protein
MDVSNLQAGLVMNSKRLMENELELKMGGLNVV